MGAAATAGPSTATTPSSPARWLKRWRWLALAGAALAFYAAWAPWTFGLFIGPFSGPHPAPTCSYLPNLSPSSLSCYTPEMNANPLFDPTLFAWLTPLGLLIVPFLWSRRFRVLAVALFALWWLYTTVMLVIAAFVIVPQVTQGHAVLSLNNTPPRLGGLAALFALALGWVALVPLVRAARKQVRDHGWASAIPLTPRRVVPADATTAVRAHAGLLSGGAGAVTAGALLWGVSLLILPWALGTCPETLQPGQACAGLSAATAMSVAAFAAIAWINPLIFQVSVPVLLVGGALLAIYAVWRLAVNPWLCAWLAVWLAAATATLVLGIAGAAGVVAGSTAPVLTNPTPYSGYVLGEVGLAFGWLGLVPLLLAALTRRKAES